MNVASRAFRFISPALPPELILQIQTWRKVGYWHDLKNPKRFTEKVQSRKLHDRDPRLPVLIDKVLVKDHVRNKLGDAWVNPTLWSGKKLPPVAERSWTVPYVIKPHHASTWMIFVKESVCDWSAIEAACDQWMKTRWDPLLLEWAYSQIDPKILIEPYLGPPVETPLDYKFYVFSGRAEYIAADTDKSTCTKRRFFNRDWVPQQLQLSWPREFRDIPKPRHLGAMLEAAEILGTGFSFVRIDLYDVDRPMFGEMTFYPGSGYGPFDPQSFDWAFGRLWVLPDRPSH
jgi:hypothetical protein